MPITDEQDQAIDRLQARMEKGVPPLTEASAHDLPLIFRAVVQLRRDNVALAEAGLRLANEAEERARHAALSMQLGAPREAVGNG